MYNENEYMDEYGGRTVYIADLIPLDPKERTKYEKYASFTQYKFLTDLPADQKGEWEDSFSEYHYKDDVWNTVPLGAEIEKFFNVFLQNYKKMSLCYQGSIGEAHASNITNLLRHLSDVLKNENIEIDTETKGKDLNLVIQVPARVNIIIEKLARYYSIYEPDHDTIGTILWTIYDNALESLYGEPYQELLPSEIYESYQN